MPPNKAESNYSKRPIKRVRLLKMGPQKSKGLLEEYFYGFMLATFAVVSILLKAGGMGAYNAFVTGLWVAGLTWFAWQLKRYFKEKSNPAPERKLAQTAKAPKQMPKEQLSPNLKSMIGPQWRMKSGPQPSQAAQSAAAPTTNNKKPAFVYERPTLPDRKPKLPANWPGRPDKKPKL